MSKRLRTMLGYRVLDRAAGLEPRGASGLYALAAKLIRGESVDPVELADALPARTGPMSLGMGFQNGELVMTEPYRKVGGRLGVMDLGGAIMFNPAVWEVVVFGGMPTAMVAQAFDAAAEDSSIDSLLVRSDCPGGSVNGCYDLAVAIDRFKAAGKRLYFLAYEQICSLAMWMACEADRIFTTPTATLGSIGTLFPMYDDSAMFQELGIVPKFIASDPHKGVGWPGVELTEENTADVRRMCAAHFEEFADRVARGRGLSVDAVVGLRAQCFMGQDAVDVGLADEVVVDVEALIEDLIAGKAGGAKTTVVPGASASGVVPFPEPEKHRQEDAMRGARGGQAGGSIEDGAARYDEVVDGITQRLVAAGKPEAAARSQAYREAAGKYPELHEAWKQENGEALTQRRADEAAERRGGRAAHRGAPADYSAEVARVSREEGVPEHQAVRLVNQRHPDLRRAYVGRGAPAGGQGGGASGGSPGGYMAKVEQFTQQLTAAGKPENAARAEAYRKAAIEHPELHEQWKQEQGQALSDRRYMDRVRRR